MRRVEDLKNYGKPLSEINLSREGKEHAKRIGRAIISELRRELGLVGLLKLALRSRNEVARGKGLDLSSLEERGGASRRFLEVLITATATGKALASIAGRDKASEIIRRGFDHAVDANAPLYPSTEEFTACGDGFATFREYMKQEFLAHVNTGLQDLDIVEDSPGALVVNVKYCLWCEVAKKLGDASLCYSVHCYWDEVFFPKALANLRSKFTRTGTLATGAPVCDFRFELLNKP